MGKLALFLFAFGLFALITTFGEALLTALGG